MPSFHEVSFPLPLALDARGGPERRTDIVTLASGREERNARWQHSRRKYDAGVGVRSLSDLRSVLNFFEERRGRLYGFRYKDPLDYTSNSLSAAPLPDDCQIGTGTGALAAFQLVKTYGSGDTLYIRPITKPVAGTVRVAVAGNEKTLGTDFTVDVETGIVTFLAGHIPADGVSVTAGFEFDVPVRFDTDNLDISLKTFKAGEIPTIPLIEILL
jgi:uncharacterized protein (TIGR02217 family)